MAVIAVLSPAAHKCISDWLIVRITSNPGETFLDHMIALVEGAKRQKTPNELALTILLAALTIVFLLVCATLLPFSIYSSAAVGGGKVVTITVLVALFVCLAPTTIGGLLSAIGIAGMDQNDSSQCDCTYLAALLKQQAILMCYYSIKRARSPWVIDKLPNLFQQKE